MSRQEFANRLHDGDAMRVALEVIKDELPQVIQRTASGKSAKARARELGCSARAVYYLRNHQGDISFLKFCALAQTDPMVRAAFARWMGLADKDGSEAERALALLRRLAANMPEAGDAEHG